MQLDKALFSTLFSKKLTLKMISSLRKVCHEAYDDLEKVKLYHKQPTELFLDNINNFLHFPNDEVTNELVNDLFLKINEFIFYF